MRDVGVGLQELDPEDRLLWLSIRSGSVADLLLDDGLGMWFEDVTGVSLRGCNHGRQDWWSCGRLLYLPCSNT